MSLIPKTGGHVPEDKDQRLVQTPYGSGTVIRSRRDDGIKEIELTDWSRDSATATNVSRRNPALLYTASTSLQSVEPTVGSDVLCLAGRGRVVEIRPSTGDLVVRLSSWRLAGRSLVTCYMQPSAVAVVRPKVLHEMSVFEKVEKSLELKQQATALFQQKNYDGALNMYSHAVDAVKYVQHKPDSSNVVRADLLVLMVTCSNNAGTCAIRLCQWDIAIRYAKQALDLLVAMEEKKGKRIHAELNKSGNSDAKVFGEWQVKSYMIMASVLAEKDEVESAMEKVKKARDIVARYPNNKQLRLKDRELVKLYSKYKERKKALANKEKQRARAMFAGTKPVNGDSNLKKNGDNAKASKKNGAKKQPETTQTPWHQNPSVLAGLCGAVGVIGICVIAMSRKRI